MKSSIIPYLTHKVIVAAAGLMLAMPLLAQEKPAKKHQPLTREEHMLLSITGTIEAIDPASREITLKGPLGHTETFVVDEKVKRFNEAKVGDAVTVDYYVGFAAELRKPTPEEEKEPLVVLDAAGKAGKSASPAAGVVRRVRAVVTIEGLDRPTKTITVKGPRGRYFTTQVADVSNLEKMRIGETILVTFTEASVVSLEKANENHKKE